MKTIIFLLCCVTSVVFAQPAQHVVWDKVPINVVLPVGVERLVSFPGAVRFGFDTADIPTDTLRVQNAAGTLYLLAKKPFAPARVQVLLSDSGNIILLNLSASSSGDSEPLSIVLPSSADTAVSTAQHASFDAVTLTRFAFQQLYAPERLLSVPLGLSRVAMHLPIGLALIEPRVIMAQPLMSWRGGDQYVTAILLRNLSKTSITLDTKALCGDLVSSSFYPNTTLAPQGTLGDSTTVALVTDNPIATALRRCLAPAEGI